VNRFAGLRGPAGVRLAIGILVSVVFLGLTLSRVDLAQLGDALRAVAPLGVAAAFGIVVLDVGIRAVRWNALLRSLGHGSSEASLIIVVAYLAIGYLANSLLPARLGDLARAYLAGSAFHTSRAATLGTILVERVGDGSTMLVLAFASSLLVTSVVEVRALAAYAAVLVAAGAVALLMAWLVVSRGRLARRRLPQLARSFAAQVAEGLAGIRTARGALVVALFTAALAGTGVGVAWTVATAAGVPLSLVEAVLFASGIALSQAIPAAPASLGTYEFVGVVILTSFGASPEQALATVLVMRLVSTLPLSILGLVAVWALHVRPATLFAAARTELIPDLDASAR
jgi:uncharacterized protein (TIRG00374 family)